MNRRRFLECSVVGSAAALTFGRSTRVEAAAGAAQTPVSGGTLVATPITAPPSLSIHEEATVATVQVVMPCYSNLVLFDPTKPRSGLDTIIPELAERWEWKEGGRALAFTLRKGVAWHDGRPFTAGDVKYTFDLVRGAPEGPQRLRVSPRKEWYVNVARIDAPTPDTVVFHLKRPQPSLLLMLASGYSPIYPAHVAPAELRQRAVGTGPFRFVKYEPGALIELERNPRYFVPGRPYLDGLRFVIIADRQTALAAVMSGRIQIGPVMGITRYMAAEARKNNPALQVFDTPTNIEMNVLMNTKRPPFGDPRMRLAVSLAIDRRAFIRGPMQGDAILGAAMLPRPEGYWGFTAAELARLPGMGDPKQDKARARQLLEAAGFGRAKPLHVAVTTRAFAQMVDVASFVSSELNEVGVDAPVETLETAVWYSRLNRRDFVLALNTTGHLDDPDATFYESYACDSIRNYTQYCNPEIEKLIDRQSTITDPEARRKVVLDIQRRLEDDAARPILGWERTSVLEAARVRNYRPQINMHNYHRMQDVWMAR